MIEIRDVSKMDDMIYSQKAERDFKEFEALCLRCGGCCGAYGGDPCLNLAEEGNGTYSCKVYENRVGNQKTASGKVFFCVPIRDLMPSGLPYSKCGYGKLGDLKREVSR